MKVLEKVNKGIAIVQLAFAKGVSFTEIFLLIVGWIMILETVDPVVILLLPFQFIIPGMNLVILIIPVNTHCHMKSHSSFLLILYND